MYFQSNCSHWGGADIHNFKKRTKNKTATIIVMDKITIQAVYEQCCVLSFVVVVITALVVDSSSSQIVGSLQIGGFWNIVVIWQAILLCLFWRQLLHFSKLYTGHISLKLNYYLFNVKMYTNHVMGGGDGIHPPPKNKD